MLTTLLDALNACLRVLGESPVDDLDSGLMVAESALNVLREIEREVQSHGWDFNIEEGITLTPNQDGEILLPEGTIRADASDPRIDVIQRGKRLYDRRNHTYVFTQALKVDLLVQLPFDELPEVARQYIYLKAARRLQWQTLGSETLNGHSEQDENEALIRLQRHELETSDFNILNSPELGWAHPNSADVIWTHNYRNG